VKICAWPLTTRVNTNLRPDGAHCGVMPETRIRHFDSLVRLSMIAIVAGSFTVWVANSTRCASGEIDGDLSKATHGEGEMKCTAAVPSPIVELASIAWVDCSIENAKL